MRTRTNIFCGEGIKGFNEFLLKNYPAGNLAIIYDDKDLAIQLFACLDKNLYTAKLKSISEEKIILPEYIRYVIGVGGDNVAECVKKLSTNKNYCYYATSLCYQYFSNIIPSTGEKSNFADFAYFDNSIINIRDTKLLANAYTNVFSMLTECILTAYYESSLPFCDNGLTGIIDGMKKLLLGGCDIDKFFGECLRLMKLGVEYLQSKNVEMFFALKTLNKSNLGLEYEFIIDYFVNMIAINFTKWDFFDMLIPAEKLIVNVSSTRPNYRGKDTGVLLSKQELSLITKKIKNLTSLPTVSNKEIVRIIIDNITESTPLLAEINNRGILEGLVKSYG
jgi:hypothetical protein